MRISPFRAVIPDLNKVPLSNTFFETVKELYHRYAAEGLFEATDAPAIFICQIKTAQKTKHNGIVACVNIAEYTEGNIKKHENTLLKSEENQALLLRERAASIKPVLMTYPSVSALEDFIEAYIEQHKKFYVIELGGEKHRFWRITDTETIKKIQTLFKENIPAVYIADGHHRTASFATLHKKEQTPATEWLLSAFFADTQLRIGAWHRIFTDLNGETPESFLEKLAQICDIEPLDAPRQPLHKQQMTLLLDKKWYALDWKKDTLVGFADGKILLDAHLLNEKILKPLLNIQNIRTDSRIKYYEGSKTIKEIEKAVETINKNQDAIAGVFCLYPIDFQDLKTIADDNGTLPPKSTFFEPRLKNGLLVYEI